MEIINHLLALLMSIDFTPLKSLIDLNDLRNLAAIAGVLITLKAASSKWGNKAVYFASLGASLTSPFRITSISIANLKDKPLIIYRINVLLKNIGFYELEKFDPPLVIKGLEATSITTTPYTNLSIQPNPFNDLKVDFDIILTTESSTIKCKAAKSPELINYKFFKKQKPIGVSRKKFNDKIYSEHDGWALIYMFQGAQRTSFLAKSGFIHSDWPFPINSIRSEDMSNIETIKESIAHIGKEYNTYFNISELI
ncbi:hypothetical protein [Pseudomonas protegens]|uniref:hypothetical protein n=1 Tax=Pseudomonas protegens TaxID=380021 RepID=UPI00215E5A57|nr:hypothetical protein [Pseudomonas protegens]UVL73886.1 hypothetical protein LOY23_06500 [Pseudomonas protegens]